MKQEMLYHVEKRGDSYIIEALIGRDDAELRGVRHLTVICICFVADGERAGQWLVHDRTEKQRLKGKHPTKVISYNAFGGHVTAADMQLVGKEIPMDIILDGASREMSEELMDDRCRGMQLDVSAHGAVVGHREAGAYQINQMLPIGYASYASADNVELSMIYAVPVPASDVDRVIGADDYVAGGDKRNVMLPISVFSESQLIDMHLNRPEIEICDAIHRLWLPENNIVHSRLNKTIEEYCQ